MLSFRAIGVEVSTEPFRCFRRRFESGVALIFCEKLFMKLENFIILSNGMLINLRYLKTITPEHTGILLRDDSFVNSITEKDYERINC